MQDFRVGDEFKLVKNYRNYLDIQGAIMECDTDGGFFLVLYLPDITLKEKENLRNGKIEFRVIEEKERGYILTLVKVGKLIFELEFDPTLYHDARQSIETLTFGNSMIIFVVDSRTNILQAIRQIGLFENLISIWGAGWQKMIKNKDCGYKNWVLSWRRFSVDMLFEMASYVCHFKEK